METSSISQHYNVAMHEKRFREIERINDENKKMANRISSQNSVLRATLLSDKCNYVNRDKSKVQKMSSSRSTGLNKSLQK